MTKASEFKKKDKRYKKAWIISVNMGYGHERAAYALRDIAAGGDYIIANSYKGIPKEEKKSWQESRKLYEAVSCLKPIPIIGDIAFGIMDKIQEIPNFYPRRDLSEPSIQLKGTFRFIEKNNIGKALVDDLTEAEQRLPFVSTFFIPSFAAELYNYPGEIYCIICDADFSRAWVSQDAKRSRIKYFAPCGRVVERLKLYGVREENIYFTGFPIPKELIGGSNAEIVKRDMLDRFCNLDPNGVFRARYEKILKSHFGNSLKTCGRVKRPLTLTFAVGGAGAQRRLGIEIIKSLREKIKRNQIQINLVAGTRKGLAKYFETEIKKLGLKRNHGKGINIIVERTRPEYFKEFTKLLRTTDILWTKPSELSFYTGAGIPIIMAPVIGSQEEFNRLWLQQIGGGVDQLDPQYANEWLFDWVNSGALARMAWNGYIEAPTHGTHRIEQIITGKEVELEQLPLVV
ncbi:MAG: hypothetical protein COU51_03085 [Parcubacteria group bacterium CG10_big_fil_rev_8_21_14_0_10_36_14]|nr:MAG: hypothetical protein COU51_03085 [Parcubacteria group bacterium CG10_big_fil_rev_8_21_14_0_10_36_14]